MQITIISKYINLTKSYKSLTKTLTHTNIHTRSKIDMTYINSEKVNAQNTDILHNFNAILMPGNFSKHSTESKIKAIHYAHENNIPYLNICLGIQLAIIEFTQHITQLKNTNSTKFNPNSPHPMIALITK